LKEVSGVPEILPVELVYQLLGEVWRLPKVKNPLHGVGK